MDRFSAEPPNAGAAAAGVRFAGAHLQYGLASARYPCYPPVGRLHGNFPLARFESWQREKRAVDNSPISLYVHLPFCREACANCESHKVITQDRNATSDYLRRLGVEIELQSARVGNQRPVMQMHWGGGTPSYLDGAETTELMHMLASHFRLMDKGYREYSIELDPRHVDCQGIALLKGLGFNRIHLGIQDLDALVQRAINRVQPYHQTERLVDSIRSHEFRSLSFDLMYGLPYQDPYTMEETLRKVVALGPDRIVCYQFDPDNTVRTAQRPIDRESLPQPAETEQLRRQIGRALLAAGYRHLGMDYYVLPGDELAVAQAEGRVQWGFQGYSLQVAEDMLGLGASAVSRLGHFYLQNAVDLSAYYQFLDQGRPATSRGIQLSYEDQLRRFIIMSFICDLRLDITECNRRFGIDFVREFDRQWSALNALSADGSVKLGRNEVRIGNHSAPFIGRVCALFDRGAEGQGRLAPEPGPPARH